MHIVCYVVIEVMEKGWIMGDDTIPPQKEQKNTKNMLGRNLLKVNTDTEGSAHR